MENKREFARELTIEELETKYKALGEELETRKRAEAEVREAKLRAEKDARYKEIVEAYKKADDLRDAFVEDYGYFTFGDDGITFSLGDFFFKMR